MDAMSFSVESRIIHAGTERAAGAPLSPPLLATSTYVSEGEPDPARGYGRIANPGWADVEEALGAIEDAGAVTFASGQAASMALMLALAEDRERIVFPDDGYYNTRTLAAKLRPHGAQPVAVDLLDLGSVERALRERLSVLWAETPTNPLLRVADLKRLGAVAAAGERADGRRQHGGDGTAAAATGTRRGGVGVLAHEVALRALGRLRRRLGQPGRGPADRAARLADGQARIPGAPFESWLVLRGAEDAAAAARAAVGQRAGGR